MASAASTIKMMNLRRWRHHWRDQSGECRENRPISCHSLFSMTPSGDGGVFGLLIETNGNVGLLLHACGVILQGGVMLFEVDQ